MRPLPDWSTIRVYSRQANLLLVFSRDGLAVCCGCARVAVQFIPIVVYWLCCVASAFVFIFILLYW